MENRKKLSLPDYDNCLVNLANSVLKRFGAQTTAATLPKADRFLEKKHTNTVILLLDAMGISIMEKHLDKNGFFRSHLAFSYNSVYPPTTVAATTSLLSGLYPDEHGWLGWDMFYPVPGKNVVVFRNEDQLTEKENAAPVSVTEDGKKIWDRDSLKKPGQAASYNVAWKFSPYTNIIDRINDAHKDGSVQAYFSSPFMPPFPQDTDAVLERVKKLCAEPGEKFIYAYLSEPDSTMHRTGTTSDETHTMVTYLEKKAEELASSLSDTLFIVTADHGHMDSRNFCILDYPDILGCLERLPSIEPRTLNLFVKEEYRENFPGIFRKHFGDAFVLLTREEVMDMKLYGKGNIREGLVEMIGYYTALAVSDVSLFNTHYEAQLMPGGHAGLTPEEYIIPFIAVCR